MLSDEIRILNRTVSALQFLKEKGGFYYGFNKECHELFEIPITKVKPVIEKWILRAQKKHKGISDQKAIDAAIDLVLQEKRRLIDDAKVVIRELE